MNAMDFNYDQIADALTIRFSGEKTKESEEISEGIIIDYNSKNSMIAIEILNFSKRKLDLNQLIKLSAEEIVPVVAQCQ